MRYIKEILNKIKDKNATTVVGASIARPPSKASTHTKTILIMLLILVLLIAALIVVGITNAANSTTEPQTSQTFTEDGDGYYIWVRAVDHAGNKGPWSEAQRVWIDNKGPSAPVIEGGSSAYALSRTISVKTEADDKGASGVAYYEYYKKSGSDKPDENVEGTKVTTSATSQTFNTNIAGEYVFFRAVDVVGNKGAWSDGQQVYIDVNVPTVTCKQANSTLTITEGDNKTLLDYFTITPTGTNKAYTAKCKVGSTEYTTTESFTAVNSPYTVTCTGTITGGNSNSTTMTVVVEAAGPAVNSSGLATENYTIKPSESSNVQIVIPAGWAPAKLTGSGGVNSNPGQNGAVSGILPADQWNNITVDQINKGIVIVNGTSDFEEYVWVPIPDSSSFARKAWIVRGTTQPLVETSTSNKYWEDKTTTEYKNMISSVTTNKGFYIGRYEASQKSGTVAQSKREKTTSTDITQAKAITYSANSSIANSHLIYGIEWDSTLNWFIGKAIIGSSTAGNTKTMTLADIQTNSESWGNYANSTGNAATNAGSKRATGYSEYWKANNIYDLAGNVLEWTQERYSTGSWKAYRGGLYYEWGRDYPAADRLYSNSTSYTDIDIRLPCQLLLVALCSGSENSSRKILKSKEKSGIIIM